MSCNIIVIHLKYWHLSSHFSDFVCLLNADLLALGNICDRSPHCSHNHCSMSRRVFRVSLFAWAGKVYTGKMQCFHYSFIIFSPYCLLCLAIGGRETWKGMGMSLYQNFRLRWLFHHFHGFWHISRLWGRCSTVSSWMSATGLGCLFFCKLWLLSNYVYLFNDPFSLIHNSLLFFLK